MNPKELRRSAQQKAAEARAIFDAVQAANRDATAEEEQRHDALVSEAESLVRKAGEIEARDGRLAALQASLGSIDPRVGDPLPHQDDGNTRGGRHGYSVVKALRQLVEGRGGAGGGLDGLEAETHQELSARRGRSPQGVLIPWDLPMRSGPAPIVGRRALDTTAGAGAIPTRLGSMIDLLRSRMILTQLGATFLTDLTGGKFALPRQNQAGTAYWVAEGAAPTTSAQTIGQVTFDPKTVGAFTDYTRKFLLLDSVDTENFVRNDLASVVGRGIETAAYNGTGANDQPKGVLQYGGSIGSIALGTNGANPDWGDFVSMESKVAIANADIGSLGYVTNAAVRGYCKTAPKIGTTFPVFLWDSNSSATPINGYPVGVTNLIPSDLTKGSGTGLSAAIFGNWSDLVVAMWGGMDVMIDPYSLSTSGGIRFVVLQSVDVNLRHPESFCICTDISTAVA